MDGVVSLHTLHHLPLAEQKKAYQEFRRVLEPGKTAVWSMVGQIKINETLALAGTVDGTDGWFCS